MNIVDILSFSLVVVFGAIGFWVGFLSLIKSLIAIVLAYLGTMLTLNPLLSLLEKFGLKENYLSPIIIYVFLIIVFWGLIYSLEISLLSKWDKKIPRSLGILPGIMIGLAVCHILYLVLFGLFGEEAILKNSKLCPIAVSSNIFGFFKNKPFVYKQKGMNGETIVTEKEKEVIIVNNLPSSASVADELGDKMIGTVNQLRAQNGLKDLQKDSALEALAAQYADEIIATKRFSHLDSALGMPSDRAVKAGVSYNYLGENLAIAPSLERAHQGLMASSSHRENLLQPLFKRVGIAVLKLNSSGSVLVVQEFSN